MILLDYYLEKGATQSILVDLKGQEIFFLEKNMTDLRQVIEEYTPYNSKEFSPTKIDYKSYQLLHYIEAEFNQKNVFSLFQLIIKTNTSFLLLYINNQYEFDYFLSVLNNCIPSDNLPLRQVYIIHKNKKITIPDTFSKSLISLMTQEELDENRKIKLQNFRVNLESISESHFYNSFHNKRIYMDQYGNIKAAKAVNSCIKIDDLINDISLLGEESISGLWKISKNSIEKCKDCEFRHLCQDSRIPKKRKKGKYYYEEKCPYNPYTQKWS